MDVLVTIEDREIEELLGRLRRRLGNLRPLMEEVGQRYERRVLENFERESSPDGTRWKPTRVLSNYLGFTGTSKGGKRKKAYTRRGGFSAAFGRYLAAKKTLVLTGRMRSRVHYQASGSSVAIGVAGIPYAAIHQFGGKAGRGKKVTIPARPWLAMNRGGQLALAERDRRMVVEAGERYLEEGK